MGVRGSAEDCRKILDKIRKFFKNELLLDISIAKTLITNTGTDFASFLGVKIKRAGNDIYIRRAGGKNIARNAKTLRFVAPIERCLKKLKNAGFIAKEVSNPKFR